MKTKTQTQVEISKLEWLAWKYYEADITDSEIRKEDVTEEFWDEITLMIEKNELINITIQGGVIKGKSTVLCAIVAYVNKILGQKMDLDKICADQYEFGRKTMTDIHDVCIGVDEFSKLETSGWNSTIESSYLDQFSDVQAQRNIHKVAASPNTIMDKNSEIIMRVINKNPKTKETTCLIYYRMFSPTGETIQLIGHVNIDVSDVIEKEWYKRYRDRKFKKMELIFKEGIFHMRDLHFAEVVLGAYRLLEPQCFIEKPNKDVVEGKAKRMLQEKKIPITSLAIEHIKSEVNSLVTQKAAELKYWKQLNKLKTLTGDQRQILIGGYKMQKEDLSKDIQRYETLIKINKAYESI